MGLIQRELRSQNENWLLCLDNADDPSVNRIIGDLCRIADTGNGNGWVLVTSRQGGVPMWNGMDIGQKLKLQPLSEKHAMLVLMRWKMSRLKTKSEDSDVSDEVERLRRGNHAEYQALLELAGSQEVYGLGGLPLALAQAGSYMYRNGDSFAAYVQLYKRTRQDSNVAELFRKIEDSGLAFEEQRSVWTTWKINVEGLSYRSRLLLRMFSLLDTTTVPELLVKHLDSQFVTDKIAYRKYVLEELVNGTSLLDLEESEHGTMFHMHRLVREFVIADAKSDDDDYRATIVRAICGISEHVQYRLLEDGNSIDDTPDFWTNDFGMNDNVQASAMKLVNLFCDCQRSSTEASCMQEVMIVFRFAIRQPLTERYFFQYADVRHLCDRLTQVLEDIYGDGTDHVHVTAALYDRALFELHSGLRDGIWKEARVEHARLLFTRAVEMLRRLFGESSDRDDVAASLLQLGMIARESGDFVGAECLLRDCLGMKRRLHGNDCVSWDVANTLFSLAKLRAEKCDRNETATLHTESYTMRRELGRRHPSFKRDLKSFFDLINQASFIQQSWSLETVVSECIDALKHSNFSIENDNCVLVAILFQKLALFFLEKGDDVEAKRVFFIALKYYGSIRIAKWECDVSYRRFCYRSDWDVFETYDDPHEMYDECLEISQRLFGKFVDDIGFAAILLDLVLSGRTASAEEYCRDCLSMYRRLLGENTDHSSISLCLYALAKVSKSNGNMNEAEKLLEESLAMDQRLYSDSADSNGMFSTLIKLAEVSAVKGDIAEAKRFYFDSREIAKRLDDNFMDEDIFHDMYVLAVKAMEVGYLDLAELVFRDCSSTARELYPPTLFSVSLQGLSNCLSELGQYDEAKKTFVNCLNSYGSLEEYDFSWWSWDFPVEGNLIFAQFLNLHRRLFEEKDHINVAKIFHNRAIYAWKEKKLGLAEHLFRESLSMKRRFVGVKQDDKSVSHTLHMLAVVMKEQVMLVESERLYRESIEMDKGLYGTVRNMNSGKKLLGLGEVLRDRGVLEEAECLIREFVDMSKVEDEFYNPDDERDLLCRLADCALVRSMFRFSERLYLDCIDISIRMKSVKDDSNTRNHALHLQKLSQALLLDNRVDEARMNFLKCMDIYARIEERMDIEGEPRCHDYMSCLELHRRLYENGLDHLGLAKLLQNIGLHDADLGDEDREWYTRKSLAMKRRVLSANPDHSSISFSLFVLANELKRSRRGMEATNLYRESLEMDRRLYGEGVVSKEIIATLRGLADVLLEIGQVSEAKFLYLESYEAKKSLCWDDSDSEEILNLYRIAIKVMETGDRSFAGTVFRECASATRKAASPFWVAVSLLELSSLMVESGNYDEAKVAFLECLKSLECVEEFEQRQHRISVLHEKISLPPQDEKRVFKKFFTLYRQLLDEDHASVARMYHDYGAVVWSIDELGSAARLFQDSLAMKRRLLGENAVHKSISLTLYSLAGVMKDQRMLAESEELYRECLEMDRSLHSSVLWHSDITLTLRELGDVLRDGGFLEEAERTIREFVTMRKRSEEEALPLCSSEEHHHECLRCLYELADSASDASAHDLAVRLNEECLTVARSRYDKFSLNLAIATLKSAHALLAASNFDEAKLLFLESLDILCLLRCSPYDYETWENMHTGIPQFVEMILEIRDQVCDDGFVHIGIANVLFVLGRECANIGKYMDAKRHHEASLTMKRQCLGGLKCDQSIANSLHELGFVMGELNELDEADKFDRECIEMRRGLFGRRADHPGLSLTMDNLHWVLREKGNIEDAESFLAESLKMNQRLNCGRMDYSKAACRYFELAGSALKNGAVDEAMRFSRECLANSRYTGNHLRVVTSMWRLALSLIENRKCREAITLFFESMKQMARISFHDHKEEPFHYRSYWFFSNINECVEIHSRLFEDFADDICYARILHDYAGEVKEEDNDLEKAEQHFRASLAMKRRQIGDEEDDSSVSYTLFALAGVMKNRNHLAESEEMVRESLAIDRRLYGDDMDNPNIAITLQELAQILLKRGDVMESKRLYLESFKMKRRLKLENFCYWEALFHVADDMMEVFAFDDAEQLFLESLAEVRRLNGDIIGHIDVACVLRGLGRLLTKRGDFNSAEDRFKESLSMYRRIHGEKMDHASIWEVIYRLACVAFEQGRLEESNQLYEDARDMARRLAGGGEDDEYIAWTLCYQSEVILEMDNTALATSLCTESLAMSRRLHGEDTDDENIIHSLLNLARIALSNEEYGDVEEFAEQSLEMAQRLYGAEAKHPRIAEAIHVLAAGQFKRGELGAAIENVKRSLEMYRGMYVSCPEHPHLVRVELDSEEWQAELQRRND